MPALTVGILSYSQASSALLFYWCVNNTFSLFQTQLLRQKSVRKYFNIPAVRKIPKEDLPPPKSIKERYTDIKESLKFAGNYDAREISSQAFEKAGTGPPKKTYKVDWSRLKSNK